MPQSEFRRRFSVDGLLYEFTAVDGGPVTFRIVGGATAAKAFTGGSWVAFDEETAPFTDEGYHRHAAPVLARVAELATEWVKSERPFGFHFQPSSERKRWIFRRMLKRHPKPLLGYTHYLHEGVFWFIRRHCLRPLK